MPKKSRPRDWMPVQQAAPLTRRSLRGFLALIRYKRIVEHEHYRFDFDGNLLINVEAYLGWASENTSRGRTKQVMSTGRTKANRQVSAPMTTEASSEDLGLRRRSESAAFAPTSSSATVRVPKLVPLEVWAEQIFGKYAPHRNTLYNWRRDGRILPPPSKCGGRYFVEPTAVYCDDAGEMPRRLGSAPG